MTLNNAMQFDITHKNAYAIFKIPLNIRCRLHVYVVARNEATTSIQLSFVPVLVIFSANNLQASQYSQSRKHL